MRGCRGCRFGTEEEVTREKLQNIGPEVIFMGCIEGVLAFWDSGVLALGEGWKIRVECELRGQRDVTSLEEKCLTEYLEPDKRNRRLNDADTAPDLRSC